jgi:anionic cell wall polymer biosynthesis LytR-Cps2A-Psr (LCP) family protein
MNTKTVRQGGVLAVAAILAGSAIFGGAPAPAKAAALAPAFSAADSQRLLGRDGRFTVLLLGSDARPSLSGLRTDAILVASVNPNTRKAAVFSIPRDVVNFPLSATRRYPYKINSLYSYLARTRAGNPGTNLRKIIGSGLGIEIDGFVMVGFTGLRKLTNSIGGVPIYFPTRLCDSYYSVRAGHHGVCFPLGTPPKTEVLRDVRRCSGTTCWTEARALAYVRIRHVDSDFGRARRQQKFIASTINVVKNRGVAALPALLSVAAMTDVKKTDVPNLAYYGQLIFGMVARADLVTAKRVVFQPTTYATRLSGTTYRIALRLSVVRQWIRVNFPQVQAGAVWLPPPPTP